ncbi:acetoin utilization protein AcuB [Aeromonas schubertii]|uniref:CBS domain-containing protein n=1 Tax=Aeromonas schubertii TaxID=652 RepID=A0ABS7VA72_9GAMM|nr:CBS domain-containing protein [Aeromonas schubertii]KUE80188.1 acetoin utilization protein AcuB [Aeromonas schubertii]MBZ6066248.1 CBS domain-containing protein [Aeromonas schubertii]MBZ6071089.1 CBS domain-containing protein [Aeromonas schubertii]
MITLSEIMTEKPFTLGPENSLKQAIDLMNQEKIRHIPVVDGEHQLLGLVTLSDVLATRESKLFVTTQEREAEFTDSVRLEELMTRNVAWVDPHAGIKEAALYLQRHKYGCLPVVERGKLIGIVTDSDFIGVAINLLEVMEEREPYDDE